MQRLIKTLGTKFFHMALDLQGEVTDFRATWLIYTREAASVQLVLSSPGLQHQGFTLFKRKSCKVPVSLSFAHVWMFQGHGRGKSHL